MFGHIGNSSQVFARGIGRQLAIDHSTIPDLASQPIKAAVVGTAGGSGRLISHIAGFQ